MRRRAGFFLTAALAAMLAFTPTAQAGPASDVINQFDDVLLGVMKNADRLGYQGRYKLLDPAIMHTFNIPLMTRIIAGSPWTNWTEAERNQVVDAFGRFVVATYARRFDGYAGERFQVDGETPLQNGILVKSALVRPHDPPIALHYLLLQNGKDWQSVDVFLTGTISEIATRRSEFSAVIQRNGFKGLLDTLESKIKVLAGGA
ncbi:MAG TPA: ABC transporter substrate-binding protein [Stellaceae bacterium]|nr:ABC transporter substrate-binding protein [Stellaceae bacterium]